MSGMIAPTFRSSMSGFNKKDVNEYISKLNYEYSQVIEGKDAEIAELKKTMDSLRAEFEQKLAQPETEAAAELEKANNLITAQTEQIEAQAQKLASLEAKLSEATSKLDFYGTKINQYDSMTTRMGEIFMEASSDADRIRTDAKAAAEALIAKTDAECSAKREAAEQLLSEISQARKEQLSALLTAATDDILGILSNFEEKTAELAKVSLDAVPDDCTEEHGEQ